VKGPTPLSEPLNDPASFDVLNQLLGALADLQAEMPRLLRDVEAIREKALTLVRGDNQTHLRA